MSDSSFVNIDEYTYQLAGEGVINNNGQEVFTSANEGANNNDTTNNNNQEQSFACDEYEFLIFDEESGPNDGQYDFNDNTDDTTNNNEEKFVTRDEYGFRTYLDPLQAAVHDAVSDWTEDRLNMAVQLAEAWDQQKPRKLEPEPEQSSHVLEQPLNPEQPAASISASNHHEHQIDVENPPIALQAINHPPPPPPASVPANQYLQIQQQQQHQSNVQNPDPALVLYRPENTLTDEVKGILNKFIDKNVVPAETPSSTIYASYGGHFKTSEEARAHRRKVRIKADKKALASDLQKVKRYGREYWVKQIYESMIDVSRLTDGLTSVHRARFTRLTDQKKTAFDEMEMEAIAHKVFDFAIAVHELGFRRPEIYHKKSTRGEQVDRAEHSVELRLATICATLARNKAMVSDVMRTGVDLHLLVDNPLQRLIVKLGNQANNKEKGDRLKKLKGKRKELKS